MIIMATRAAARSQCPARSRLWGWLHLVISSNIKDSIMQHKCLLSQHILWYCRSSWAQCKLFSDYSQILHEKHLKEISFKLPKKNNQFSVIQMLQSNVRTLICQTQLLDRQYKGSERPTKAVIIVLPQAGIYTTPLSTHKLHQLWIYK